MVEQEENQEIKEIKTVKPQSSGKVMLIKVIGLVFFLLSSVISLMLTEMSSTTYLVLGLSLTLVAISNFVPIKIKYGNEIMLVLGAIVLISMNMYTAPNSIMKNNFPFSSEPTIFILSVLYVLFLIGGLEYSHAGLRFDELVRESSGIQDFPINVVIKDFMARSFPMLIIAIVIASIISHSTGILASISPPQLSRSLEMTSLYALAMMSAIIFVPAGIGLALTKKSSDDDAEK